MPRLVFGLLLLSIGVCSARSEDLKASGEDLKAGHQLAAMLCGQCHLAAPDQPFAPDTNPPAPSFKSIAQRQGISADSLTQFLATTHQGLDRPKGMPSPYLADYQIKQVVAYILSLRE
jgi:mono/diheme cytochrome c family protein